LGGILITSILKISLFGRSINPLRNRDIQWRLPKLVYHKEMVWSVLKLRLHQREIILISDELVGPRIAKLVDAVILRVKQIRLNAIESLHFKP